MDRHSDSRVRRCSTFLGRVCGRLGVPLVGGVDGAKNTDELGPNRALVKCSSEDPLHVGTGITSALSLGKETPTCLP